jgi:hypothetical protein
MNGVDSNSSNDEKVKLFRSLFEDVCERLDPVLGEIMAF